MNDDLRVFDGNGFFMDATMKSVIDALAERYGIKTERIEELLKAEQEGRNVVIPYKWLYERLGDYAYMVDDEVIEVIICSVSLDAKGNLFIGAAANDGSEFYAEFESVEVTTRLFETRAEAELALLNQESVKNP